MNTKVYILAGGLSKRFGTDKARATVIDRPLITQVAHDLRIVDQSPTVVADRADKYSDLGLRTIADDTPHLGPLGGLQRALEDTTGPSWIMLAPCDLLGLEQAWLDSLLRAAAQPGGGQAVAFRDGASGRWQPLPGLYHTSCRLPAAALLAEEGRALWRLLDRCGAREVPLPPGWDEAVQVNTPDDLEQYLNAAPR